MAKFVKGNKEGAKRGLNKITRTVKETVLMVFNKLQEDATANLEAFAKEYPKEFYAIAAKLIPTELTANVTGTVSVTPSKEEAAAIAAVIKDEL